MLRVKDGGKAFREKNFEDCGGKRLYVLEMMSLHCYHSVRLGTISWC